MSTYDNNSTKEQASDTFVFTNSDREPVTCDKNPAQKTILHGRGRGR